MWAEAGEACSELGPDVARLLGRAGCYETSFLGMGIMAGPDLQAFLHSTPLVQGVRALRCAGDQHLIDLALAPARPAVV
ncbi:hypothetical protein GS464_18630 [Rhodococcus hoagii]|nr:hypothetical protein [Prescottella equi]